MVYWIINKIGKMIPTKLQWLQVLGKVTKEGINGKWNKTSINKIYFYASSST